MIRHLFAATMLATALMRHGPGLLKALQSQLVSWMDENEYQDLEQMKGSMSYEKVAVPSAYERANYMKMLHSL